MRKIIFHLETGLAGMEATENGVFDPLVTDEELEDEAWQRAVEHAASYGVYPECDRPCFDDPEDEDEEGWNNDHYTDNIEGYWEDYVPERHDGLVCGGGKWNWNI